MILPTMILVFRKNFQFSFLQNLLIIAQIKNRTPDFETSIVFFYETSTFISGITI